MISRSVQASRGNAPLRSEHDGRVRFLLIRPGVELLGSRLGAARSRPSSADRAPVRHTGEPVTRDVDMVIAGRAGAAFAATVAALRDGRHVLVVLRAADAHASQRFRRQVRIAAGTGAPPLAVLTNVEVVCVDGIGTVEAVVLRHARTGRVSALNARSYMDCDGAEIG